MSLSAETVILECTADGSSNGGDVGTRGSQMRLPGIVVASFRTWNVTGWKVESGALFLHLESGLPPDSVEIAALPEPWGEIEPPRLEPAKLKFVVSKVQTEPEGWITMSVPAAIVENLATNKVHGIAIRFKGSKELVVNARESGAFPPYLIVTGARR